MGNTKKSPYFLEKPDKLAFPNDHFATAVAVAGETTSIVLVNHQIFDLPAVLNSWKILTEGDFLVANSSGWFSAVPLHPGRLTAGTWEYTCGKGKSSPKPKPSFSDSMLILGGVLMEKDGLVSIYQLYLLSSCPPPRKWTNIPWKGTIFKGNESSSNHHFSGDMLVFPLISPICLHMNRNHPWEVIGRNFRWQIPFFQKKKT